MSQTFAKRTHPLHEKEYRTTFATIPPTFPDPEHLVEQLIEICPRPPRGQNWHLVSTLAHNGFIFFYWERPSYAALLHKEQLGDAQGRGNPGPAPGELAEEQVPQGISHATQAFPSSGLLDGPSSPRGAPRQGRRARS